mgnify:CR=1 FL=1
MSEIVSNILWKDRRRRLGMPLSFTRYRLTEDRLFCETGFFNIREEEILLYRIRDLELKLTLGQRLFGVGSIFVHSSDKTQPNLELKNIKNPREVKELLSNKVEECKDKRRMRSMEIVDDGCEHEDFDPDGEIDTE